ncbi:hypothetical protein DL546_002743 [Coniochaeta pulveracea]|uniref:Uncharacterized protein n=1 Tax=Coniochaeta pulveracea TaxID=177199 RepID=A0A420Y889_9PEZI|nr:hypothetical protein DL546_002743 [Coniochaeta pulveracea]
MDAMVLQPDSCLQCPVEHGCWYRLPSGSNKGDEVELERTVLHTAAMLSSLNPGLIHAVQNARSAHLDGGNELNWKNFLQQTPSPLNTQITSAGGSAQSGFIAGVKTDSTLVLPDTLGSAAPTAPTAPSSIPFQQVVLPLQEPWAFPPHGQLSTPEQALKRRRPTSDVDGPNTATLGCKKRRLRRNLITSRLSRPFSLPATHIINREFAAINDKRFLKLSAILSARWRIATAAAPVHPVNHSSPSGLLRRAAMINRLKQRLRERAMEGGDLKMADMATNAAVVQESQVLGVMAGARFPTSSWCQVAPMPLLHIPGPGTHTPPTAQAAAQSRLSPHSSQVKPMVVRATSAGGKLSRSPRMKPVRSPDLRSSRPPAIVAGLDDDEYLDDEEASFPTSEYESRYDLAEEPDDVYADFGIIFSGGNVDDFADGEGDHYDDYMDDMDGIPWTVR